MTEADFQSKFTKWLKAKVTYSSSWELKLSKTTSLPFSALKDHQIANLLSVKHRKLVYKIPDSGYDQKPFDCLVLKGRAYVVIIFYLKRGDNTFYAIDIDNFVDFRDSSLKSGKKSITKEYCEAICDFQGVLK